MLGVSEPRNSLIQGYEFKGCIIGVLIVCAHRHNYPAHYSERQPEKIFAWTIAGVALSEAESAERDRTNAFPNRGSRSWNSSVTVRKSTG